MGLRGFGGKMILARATGIAAGDVLGDQHVGRMMASVMGGLMFGGPVVTGVIAGLEGIGLVVRANREALEAARKSASDYMSALEGVVSTWSGMATSLVERGSFGQALERESQRATAASLKSSGELAKHSQEGMGFGDAAKATWTYWTDWSTTKSQVDAESAFGQKYAGLDAQNRLESQVAAVARRERDKATTQELKDQREIADAKVSSYQVSYMKPGLLKEEAALKAKINLEDKESANRDRAELVQQATAVEMARTKYKLLEDYIKEIPKDVRPEARAEAEEQRGAAKRDLDDAEKALGQIKEQQANRGLERGAAHHSEIIAQNQKNADTLYNAEARTMGAETKLTMEGYEQKKALHWQNYQAEVRAAQGQGREILWNLWRQYQLENSLAEKEEHKRLDVVMARYDKEAALREYQEKRKTATEGMTKAQKEAWEIDALQGKSIKSVADTLERIAVLQGRITRGQAEYNRLVRDNPLAQSETSAWWQRLIPGVHLGLSEEAKKLREGYKKEAEVAQQERTAQADKSLKSGMQKEAIDMAERAGTITRQKADKLRMDLEMPDASEAMKTLAVTMKEASQDMTQRNQDARTLGSTAYTAGYIDFKALSPQNSDAKIQHGLLEQIRQLLAEIEKKQPSPILG